MRQPIQQTRIQDFAKSEQLPMLMEIIQSLRDDSYKSDHTPKEVQDEVVASMILAEVVSMAMEDISKPRLRTRSPDAPAVQWALNVAQETDIADKELIHQIARELGIHEIGAALSSTERQSYEGRKTPEMAGVGAS